MYYEKEEKKELGWPSKIFAFIVLSCLFTPIFAIAFFWLASDGN